MRLARGSGVDGLSGMAPVQKLETAAGDLQILRPFLETDPHFWPVLCEGPNLTGLKTPAIWTINLSGCDGVRPKICLMGWVCARARWPHSGQYETNA